MMGQDTSLPVRGVPLAYCLEIAIDMTQIFISPAGMASLAHPLGERLLAKAAGDCSIIQMVSPLSPLFVFFFNSANPTLQISTNASAPLNEIVDSRTSPTQPFFMQLYVDRNRPKTEALLERINAMGMRALFVTVDAPAPGKREADERSRAEVEVVSGSSPRSSFRDIDDGV